MTLILYLAHTPPNCKLLRLSHILSYNCKHLGHELWTWISSAISLNYTKLKKITKLRQGIQGSILKHNSFNWITASLQVYDTCIRWVIMICAGTSYAHHSICARSFLNTVQSTTTVCLYQSFQSCLHSMLSWSWKNQTSDSDPSSPYDS